MTKIETLRFAYNYIWCLSDMLKNGGAERSGEFTKKKLSSFLPEI